MPAGSVVGYVRAVLYQLRRSIRARIPEKVVIWAAYLSNFLLVVSHHVFGIGEASSLVLWVNVVVCLQLLLPFLLLDFIPIFHYFALLAFLASGSVGDVVFRNPVYYYLLTLVTVVSVVKVEPVLPQSPLVMKVSTRVKRAFKRARVPRTWEEAKFSLKLGFVHVLSAVASLVPFFLYGYAPSILVFTYSVVALILFLFGVGASFEVRPSRRVRSFALLFIMRYPFLFRWANRLKLRASVLVERAGEMIDVLEFVSRYLAVFIWYVMLLPTILLYLSMFVPGSMLALLLAGLLAGGYFVYRLPFIILNAKIRSRAARVDKELPIFLVFASALVSAGLDIYSVFKELVTSRGSELFKAFTREARFFVSLVENRGMTVPKALERYIATHPSREYKNFLMGYVNQLRLGGNMAVYMEQKVMEALDAWRRRMENYVNQVVTLSEIAITVLVMPLMPMTVGFILAPDIVYSMMYAQMFAFVPLVGVLFYAVASRIQLELGYEYRFTYIPSVLGGLAGLAVGFLVAGDKVVAAAAFVVAGIAFGNYLEYYRQRRFFAEVERALPQFFRDLSDLRALMPISEALRAMSRMEYPESVSRVLRRMSTLKAQGVGFDQQPWHSKSWFWKFTQFLLGEIEKSGGGTPELFRQLLLFFTEFKNIVDSVRGALKIYEMVIYVVPAVVGFVAYSTLGIFTAMGQLTQSMGVLESPEMASLLSQFPQFARMMRGVDPQVIFVNDIVILEMAVILGFLAGKVVSGTLRDTRALGVAALIAGLVILVAPGILEKYILGKVGGLVSG